MDANVLQRAVVQRRKGFGSSPFAVGRPERSGRTTDCSGDPVAECRHAGNGSRVKGTIGRTRKRAYRRGSGTMVLVSIHLSILHMTISVCRLTELHRPWSDVIWIGNVSAVCPLFDNRVSIVVRSRVFRVSAQIIAPGLQPGESDRGAAFFGISTGAAMSAASSGCRRWSMFPRQQPIHGQPFLLCLCLIRQRPKVQAVDSPIEIRGLPA